MSSWRWPCGDLAWAVRAQGDSAEAVGALIDGALGHPGEPLPDAREALLVTTPGADWRVNCGEASRQALGEGPVTLAIPPLAGDPETVGAAVLWVAAVLALPVVARGGALLHGALAEQHGRGVLLAAAGGTGKSTASARLPEPWRSHSDDTTLVVRDAEGGYRAHPWPTWSRFLWGGPGGQWAVHHSTPLRGAYFLRQAPHDEVTALGRGETAVRLGQAAEQALGICLRTLAPQEARALRRTLFDTMSAMAAVVPGHQLGLTLHGSFWELLEHASP